MGAASLPPSPDLRLKAALSPVASSITSVTTRVIPPHLTPVSLLPSYLMGFWLEVEILSCSLVNDITILGKFAYCFAEHCALPFSYPDCNSNCND